MSTTCVVMSVYNGEKYLEEQLESLVNQSCPADSVIIADDMSTDGTFDLVRSFIDKNGLDNWQLFKNERNLGWMASFRNLISLADADYIFPCDQDDIWDLDKIEAMKETLDQNPDLDVVACLVAPFYEQGSTHTWAASDEPKGSAKGSLERPVFEPHMMYVQRPGCAYCFRKAFALEIQDYWKDSYPHDATLWRFSAVKGSLGLYQRSLVNFRRHDSNASTPAKVNSKDRLDDLDYYVDFSEALIAYLQKLGKTDVSKMMEQYKTWTEARIGFVSGKRRLRSLPAVMRHLSWYAVKRSFGADAACSLHVL